VSSEGKEIKEKRSAFDKRGRTHIGSFAQAIIQCPQVKEAKKGEKREK